MSIATGFELYRYLNTAGYNIASLKEIFTSGATQCRYFSLLLQNGDRRFVKIGEKVDLEIENLNYFNARDFTDSPKVLTGSSLGEKLLITNWATVPTLGYDLVHSFHKGLTKAAALIEMQETAFGFLRKLYSFPTDLPTTK